MKENLKNKIGAIKSIAQRSSKKNEPNKKRQSTNSLSLAIRDTKEAESFRAAYKSAAAIAKSK